MNSEPRARFQQVGDDSYINFLAEKNYLNDIRKLKKGSPTTLPDDVYLDGLFTKMAEQYLSRQKNPFFLWLNYSVPHGPYDVKADYHRFKAKDMPRPNAADDRGQGIPKLLRPHPLTNEKKLQKDQLGNCANIAFLDDQLARIMASLKKNGLSENTIVVFFSDHGILVGDHGLTHKSTLYREVLNPTLIIWDPRSSFSGTVERPVELLDLVKTALDWGGAAMADKREPFGESLLPLLQGKSGYQRQYASAESPGYFALVSERYKYIAPLPFNKSGGTLLFDLQADPAETRNVAAAHPQIVARFAKAAAKWLQETGPE